MVKNKSAKKQNIEREQLHCLLEQELADDLSKYCQETGLTRTVVVRKALIEYLSRKKGRL